MKENLNHIDSLFKDALEEYSPPHVQEKKAYGMWLRLFFAGLGIKSLMATMMILLSGALIFSYYQWGGEVGNEEQKQANEMLSSEQPVSEQKMKTKKTTVSPTVQQGQASNPTEGDKNIDGESGLIPGSNMLSEEKGVLPSQAVANNLYDDQAEKLGAEELSGNHALSYQMSGNRTRNFNTNTARIGKRSQVNVGLKLKTLETREEKLTLDSIYFSQKRPLQFALLFTLNPGLVFNHIENSPENGAGTSIQAETEPFIPSIGFGAEFRMERNSWYLQAGLNYANYGEDVTYSQKFLIPDYDNLIMQVDTTWGWIYDPPSIGTMWPLSIDTSYQPSYDEITNVYQVSNRYHYIEIPVQFGYQNYFRQYSYFVQAGINMGFIVAKSGDLPGADDSTIENASNYNFRTPQFNFIFQAGIGIPIANRVDFILEPGIKYSLNSIFHDPGYTNKHKYFVFGLNVGIMVHLD